MSTAEPNPNRPRTLVELSSCANCSRVVQRVVLDEHGRSGPGYDWTHRHSGVAACDEADVAYRAACMRGMA